jgi:hypothetical protein
VTFAVVCFYVFVQTLFMIPLLHRLGPIRLAISVSQESRLGEYVAQTVDDMTDVANVGTPGTAH